MGYQVVWATLAMRSDVDIYRLFTDVRESLPRSPELVGFSLSWELDYVNILNLLELLEIPLRSSDRGDKDPLVFGGGPVLSANPEPFADFFDVILVGDGEDLLGNFVTAYQQVRTADRLTKLKHLAQVPGIYIPSLYQVEYAENLIVSIVPIESNIPATITKQTYRGNTPFCLQRRHRKSRLGKYFHG